jgi:hypothetical protein
MIRPIATELGLFLAPFVVYAAFLLATRAGIVHPDAWTMRRVTGLVIVSLILMAGSFLVLAEFGGAPPGSTYVPAHIEDGKFVPQTTR